MKTHLLLLIAGLMAVMLTACQVERAASLPPAGTFQEERITPAAILSSSAPVAETAAVLPAPAILLPTPTLQPQPTPFGDVPADTPLPTSTSSPTLTMDQASLPARDLNKLALKFTPFGDVPEGATKSGQEVFIPSANPLRGRSSNFSLGDTDTLWVSDNSLQNPRQFQITARLAYLTDHAYWWVQEGFTVAEADLIASAERFEDHTYPTNRLYFGSEWSPGIDNDVRIHILMGDIPGVGGYYSSANEYSQFANEHSNQREMFLINLKAIQPGNDQFDGVLAHEFQHMIHWHQDLNEDAWLNEGLSELAQYLNGYGLSGFTAAYLSRPDVQLTTWGLEARMTGINYGASFLFSAYLLDKFGPEALRQVVAQPDNGLAGIEQTLQEMGYDITADEIFAGFIIANYLNKPDLAAGQWGYALSGFELSKPGISAQHNTFPVTASETVQQYGVDYIELTGQAGMGPTDLAISFDGSTTAKLLDNEPHSGRYQWYSNRGDAVDTTLTQAFDLSHLTQATLKFWAWYDIEADWDYAYVTLSTDEGQTWHILPATTTDETNRVGNAYGPGFTGLSATPPQWVEERVDLTPFAGQPVWLRFEYITDDAINMPGFAIDDISIPELGYIDDIETDAGWLAEGFVRTENILPQWFMAQIIIFDSQGQITVNRIPLDAHNHGQYTVRGFGQEVRTAILVISAQSPVTTIPASYTYAISP